MKGQGRDKLKIIEKEDMVVSEVSTIKEKLGNLYPSHGELAILYLL